MNKKDILKEIKKLNHEININDDNREQDYLMNKISYLQKMLKEK